MADFAFRSFQFHAIHGMRHAGKWKHPLNRKALQIFVGVLVGDILGLIG
jgi:hypothetical protein